MKDCFRKCLCKNPVTHCGEFNPTAEICINCEEALVNIIDGPHLSPVDLVTIYPMIRDRLRTVEEDKVFMKLRDVYHKFHHGVHSKMIATRVPERLVNQVLGGVLNKGLPISGIRFMGANCVIRWGVEDKDDPTNQVFLDNVSITGRLVVYGTLVQWGRVIGGREELYQL